MRTPAILLALIAAATAQGRRAQHGLAAAGHYAGHGQIQGHLAPLAGHGAGHLASHAAPAPAAHLGGYRHGGSNLDGEWDGRLDADPNWRQNWEAANQNWAAGLQRIASSNAQYIGAANKNWQAGLGSVHYSNPRWACGRLPGAVCVDDQPHAARAVAHSPAAVIPQQAEEAPEVRLQNIGRPDARNVGYRANVEWSTPSPWRNAPAHPSTLWSCSFNPSACTADVNWAQRGYSAAVAGDQRYDQ